MSSVFRPLDAALVILAFTSVVAAPAPLQAQGQTREAAALAVVQKLFDAMAARDTAAIRATFDPQARLVNGAMRNGRTVIETITVDQFVTTIASAAPGSRLSERIYSPEVRIDGNLATVWAFYTFHVGERFSHCGVDAAQLFETAEGWRIIHLADTRRREGCDPPRT